MKQLLLLSLVLFPTILFSQGATCAAMDPICTDVGANFTANTGTTAEPGNNYGCLATQPNPSWYYFEIATNGNIDMNLFAPSDIDFIIWGPYPNLAAAQANCGTLGAGNQVDCSYSSTNNESPSIPNAQVGEVYIMLITNYASVVQDVTLTQVGGTGSTDCDIVNNPPCFMDYFDATISACDPANDTYSVSGQIDFDDPPTTGDLIVVDCNGNQVVVASAPFAVNASNEGTYMYNLTGSDANGLACDITAYFSADPSCALDLSYTAPECLCAFTYMSIQQHACDPVPGTFLVDGFVEFQSPPTTGTLTFTNSCTGATDVYNAPFTSPQTYSFPGIVPAGGTNCTVTAVFSDNPGCSMQSLSYNDPANCECPVDIGTFTETTTGDPSAPYEMCFGEVFTVTPNGNFIPHDDFSFPGVPYNPAIGMGMFSCPPSVNPPFDLNSDPCFLGFVDMDISGGWTETNIFGDCGTYWYAPISIYSYVAPSVYYAIQYMPSGFICYDIGPAWPLTSLAPVNAVTTQDCFAGTATATLTGGSPQCNGSTFNIVPFTLVPNNASFVNTSAGNGGTITIQGLLDGDAYSYDVTDESGCVITVSGVFTGLQDASFSYNFKYCQDEPNPLPVITGVAGGSFSATPAGIVINPATGLINLAASTPGTYTIQYESPAATCWGTETFALSINPLPLVVPTEDSPICDDGVSTIQLGETGGEATEWLWSSNGGSTITNTTDQNPVVSNATNGEIFTVDVTNVNTGCSNSATIAVTVTPLEDATFSLTDFCAGAANSATVTGTAGGTFTFNPAPGDGATINGATGEISNEVGGTTYSIEYTTPGVCFDSSIETVTVNPTPTVDPIADIAECAGTPISASFTGTVGGTQYNWTNTNTGIGLAANGTGDIASFNGVNAGATPIVGTVTVTPTANGCTGISENFTITINPLEDATFTLTDFCEGAANSATITGTTGGTFTFNPAPGDGATINPTTGEISNEVGGTTYTVEYTTAGVCFDVTTETVTVNPTPTVDPIADIEECAGTAISVTFTGAVGGTQYDWTNTNTGIGLAANGTGNIASFNGVNAGATPIVGTVTVTPTANGCVGVSEDFTITINPLEDATFTLTDYCEGAANSATIVGSVGGTFAFNPAPGDGATINGTTGEITNGVGGTTYTVEYTTAGVCFDVTTETVTVNPTPTVDPIADIEECAGTAISVTFTGAVGGTQYDWTNTNTGIGLAANGTGNIASFNGVNAGATPIVGTVTVTPTANGCVGVSEDFTITINPLEDATFTLTDYCEGAANSATIVGSVGGTFAFNPAPGDGATINGTTGEITNGVGGTTYTVEYTTAGVCFDVTTETVTVNPTPTVDPITDIEECAGTAISVTFTGAVGGTQYDWTNTNTGIGLGANGTGNIASFNGVNAGAAPIVGTVTVTPTANGCVGASEDFTITINPLEDATFTLTDYCEGAANSATIVGSAGGTFTFNPAPGDGATINVGTGEITNGVGGTTYTVEYTTAGVCFDATTETVTVNPLDDASFTLTDFCESAANSATGIVTAGGTFTFNPAPGDGATVNGGTGEITNGVGGTSYSIEYTTAGICPQSTIENVTVNPLGDPSFLLTDFCEGATNVANVTGDLGGSFVFNPVPGDGATVNGATGEISNEVGGTTYTVEYTTTGICPQSSTENVTVNPNPTPFIDGDTEYCQGTSATVSSDATYASYNWSTGDNTQNITVTVADNPITLEVTNGFGCTGISPAYNVAENNVLVYNSSIEICQGESINIHGNMESTAGVYTATFPLPNGCDSTANVTLVVNPLPVVNAGADVTLCNGESTVLQGTGADSYAWDNGLGIGNNFNVSPTVTTTYEVTGTDANGCSNTDEVEITVNPLPTATIAGTTAICDNDPSPDVTITGANGTAPYTYTYNINGGADIVVVSVGNDAVISVPNSPSGTYTYNLVSVEDASATNCSQSQVGSATITINPNPTPSITGDVDYCEGFTATISADAVYTTYDWSTGDNTQSIDVTAADNPITLTVTNGFGCSGTSVAYNVTENPTPIVDAGNDVTICLGDETTLTASGATTYSWDNGLGAGNNFDVSPVVNTIYTVTGTDANGCVGTDDMEVTVNDPPTANITGTATICVNDVSPEVTFTGANGTAPYIFTYTINGGTDLTVSSGAGNDAVVVVPNNPAGTYVYDLVHVEESSANNCGQDQVGSVTITINPNPTPSITGDVDYCEGFTATISADAVYTTYDWSTGDNTQSIDVTAADNPITLTVTNGFGCSGTSATYNVTENPTPIVDAGNDVTICIGAETTLSASGAVNYSWDNGLGVGNNFDVSPLVNTTYTVVGTDANGCIGTDNMEVFVNDPPTATITGTATICENDVAPQITFTGADGTAPYTFTYNINGGPDLTANSGAGNTAVVTAPNSPAGTYVYNLLHVEESSVNNCGQDQVGSVTITVNGLPNVNAGADITACDGDDVTLNASGAVDYVWDNGVTDGVAFTPTNGVYTVIGTDANGCENSDNLLITVSPIPVPSFTVDAPICEPFIVTLTNTTPGVSANCVWQLSGMAPINGCGPITMTLSDYGSYNVTLTTTNAGGCTASTTVVDAFTLEESPNAAFTPPYSDISSLNTEVHFFNNSTGASSYEWHFGDGTASSSATNPSHTYPDESGNYTVMLIASSDAGCADTAYGHVRVRLEVIYYVPNTFTPDNDSYNQFFKPVFTSGYDPYDYSLLIFNRWGEIIFESHDVDKGWDGTYAGNYVVQDGTYTWKIEFKTIETDERIMDIGHVNVLR